MNLDRLMERGAIVAKYGGSGGSGQGSSGSRGGPGSRGGGNGGGRRGGKRGPERERDKNRARRDNARASGAGGGGRNQSTNTRSMSDADWNNYQALKAKEAERQQKFDAAGRLEQLEMLIRDNPNANADQKAAWITEAEGLRYEQYYRTENQRLMGELEKSPLLDAAKAEAQTLTDNGFTDADQQARVARMAGRQGLNVTQGQQDTINRAYKFNNANTVTSMLDEARMAEQTRKDGLRGELINLGRGIATSATQSMTEAAGNQVARDNMNAQAKYQDSKAKKQGLGSMAGAGIGFAVGGPVGAFVGGTAGSFLGNLF